MISSTLAHGEIEFKPETIGHDGTFNNCYSN